MKKTVIGLLVLIVFLGLGVFVYNVWQQPQESDGPSDSDIISTITGEFSHFLSDNKPVITISDLKRVENSWYIVTIRSVHDKEGLVPVRVILFRDNSSDKNNTLKLVAGPDTYFTEARLLQYNVPDSVIMELQRL